jgi:hypothetical protein
MNNLLAVDNRLMDYGIISLKSTMIRRHMKRFLQSTILPCILVLGMFFLGVQITHAFTTFTGDPKWANANPGYIIDASYKNQGPGWENVANNSANDWNALTNSPLRFFLNGGAGDNHITAGTLSCSNGLLAGTVNTYAGNSITKFTITVNVGCGFPFYDGTQAPSLPPNYFNLQSVVEHELGHGIGLCHSALNDVLMRTALPAGIVQIRKKDDNQGNRFLYQAGYSGPGPTGRCDR